MKTNNRAKREIEDKGYFYGKIRSIGHGVYVITIPAFLVKTGHIRPLKQYRFDYQPEELPRGLNPEED